MTHAGDDSEDELRDAGPQPEVMSFKAFLEGIPPSQTKSISDLWERKDGSEDHALFCDIQLHCSHDNCQGVRYFRYGRGEAVFSSRGILNTFVTYVCSNCQHTTKHFSLYLAKDAEGGAGNAYKFGELPPYGAPTPTRLIRLLGEERESFLKGRRCENQGLGIGAFVYYRRVVENKKDQILDEIIKVATKLGIDWTTILTLENAKQETVGKALASVRNAVPQALLINGQNPLTLLHSALSEGLHEASDEECLELAQSIRVVLIELVERIGQALRDEAEVNAAIARLTRVKIK